MRLKPETVVEFRVRPSRNWVAVRSCNERKTHADTQSEVEWGWGCQLPHIHCIAAQRESAFDKDLLLDFATDRVPRSGMSLAPSPLDSRLHVCMSLSFTAAPSCQPIAGGPYTMVSDCRRTPPKEAKSARALRRTASSPWYVEYELWGSLLIVCRMSDSCKTQQCVRSVI